MLVEQGSNNKIQTARPRCTPLRLGSPTSSASLTNQFRFMESTSVPSQLTVSSPIRRETGRYPGWTLPGFVKFPKYSSKSGLLRTKLCLANANAGGFGQEMHGVGNRDGVIIVDHGSHRKESNLMLNEFVAMFIEKTGYPIVEPAHMELAEPSIKDAFSTCVQRGAQRVIVSPFFLFLGRHWHQDIPSLTADAAKEHPGISYVITAPLGLHGLLVDVLNDRIKHCLSHVAGDADECYVCAGTGKCRLNQSP